MGGRLYGFAVQILWLCFLRHHQEASLSDVRACFLSLLRERDLALAEIRVSYPRASVQKVCQIVLEVRSLGAGHSGERRKFADQVRSTQKRLQLAHRRFPTAHRRSGRRLLRGVPRAHQRRRQSGVRHPGAAARGARAVQLLPQDGGAPAQPHQLLRVLYVPRAHHGQGHGQGRRGRAAGPVGPHRPHGAPRRRQGPRARGRGQRSHPAQRARGRAVGAGQHAAHVRRGRRPRGLRHHPHPRRRRRQLAERGRRHAAAPRRARGPRQDGQPPAR
mmetsp:Transcript_34582/g.91255  ORF Transcript_34582/g.91255 Transcript_34582/m.91255 type:complete len:274 (-) Transcript_34582:148-969(-)